MELRVQLLSGMSGLQENCGDGNYRREVRASDDKRCPALILVAGYLRRCASAVIMFSGLNLQEPVQQQRQEPIRSFQIIG